MIYSLFRPLFFQLDPESAHALVMRLLGVVQHSLEWLRPPPPCPDALLAQQVFGLQFPNPVGLAAGFDKNAERPHVWAGLGFGFAELGTVTARPQPGNPPPRIFRLPADRALINRLGFNNHGAERVARDLAARLSRYRPAIPLGINIGKSRAVPLEEAVDDYRISYRALAPLADYVVVNVSSPNTPGLRDLQSAAQLEPLLSALGREARGTPKPLLVKVAPDLSDTELREIFDVAHSCGAAGIVATNTTIERPALHDARLASEAGGLSGAPLREISTRVVRTLYRHSGGRMPIIGVGGIFTAADAYEKIRAGAALVQIYTAFIYEGPAAATTICSGLRELLARDGLTNVSQAVGRDA